MKLDTFFKCLSAVVLFSVMIFAGGAEELLAQERGDTLKVQAPRTITAYSKKGDEIHLDGKLTEDIWRRVSYTSHFTQREPNEGAEATSTTKVAFVYSEDALYIGARMFSNNPAKIQAQLSRRDEIGNSERIIISLDTYLDRRTSRSFVITASSVRADYFQPEDEMDYRSRDYSFDPVWEAESNIDSLGWTTEMRIPFSQLRYSEKEEQVWGLNINRFIPQKNEDDYWVMVPQNETGWASRFGLLTGIENISKARQIEFLPYVAGSALLPGAPDPKNPFINNVNWEGRIGGDFKIGLGPNLKLDGTINPDFGQVEADPAQVNLSAFETFFEEKRPFFTENQQLFRVLEGGGRGGGRRSDRYFYSRRIGAAPSIRPGGDKADYIDQAQNTSIIGASKITGRFPSGLSVGGLATITAKEKADIYDEETATFDQVTVEPPTGYSVLRAQQEFGEYSSTVGGILTGVYRDLRPGTRLYKLLNHTAITGGTDWNLRFEEGKYQVSGDMGFSYISGSKEAMLEAQQSSARYYQRPDADYIGIDSSRTQLSGYRAKLGFSKNSGKHWLWRVEAETKSPGFELNDTGILFRADNISSQAELTYRETNPSSWYQNYRFEVSWGGAWNYGGTLRENQVGIESRIEWKNFWSTFIRTQYSLRTFGDRLTRGGPLMGEPRKIDIVAGLFTNRSSNVFAQVFGSYKADEFGGWDIGVRPSVQIRTGGRWSFEIEPRFSLQTNTRQYITTLSGGPQRTFGKRYIFSNIDRSTLSLQTRVNYSFSPDFTLELYAEPFVATGNYYSPGELPSPRSYQLDRYQVDRRTADGDYVISRSGSEFEVPDRDFLVKSFRSSMVLRYQWKPGSTFFLVWQQNRFAQEEKNRFLEPGDLVNALGETGDNIFSIKFTYWIPAN